MAMLAKIQPDKMLFLVALVAGACIIAAPRAGAEVGTENRDIRRLSHVERRVDTMSDKFWRGVINLATGVGEIPRQISDSCRRQGAAAGIPTGLVKGLVMAPVRMGVGAFEAATWFMPVMPNGRTPPEPTYEPVMLPEFVWQDG
jgi:putative exosortase-associated protein (TIGR04073 family)